VKCHLRAGLASLLLSLPILMGAAGAHAAVPAGAEGSERPGASVGEDAPSAIVEAFHDALTQAMKRADELGYEGRYAELSPVLEGTFDLDFMAEKSVGRYWRDLDEAARNRWLETFTRHTTANYAGRFNAYTGQHFETRGSEPAAHETVVVNTVLVLPAEEDVQLNYRLRKTPLGWRVVDIYLNGTVSELALRRSEYSAVISRDGFDTLVSELDGKIADMAAGKVQ